MYGLVNKAVQDLVVENFGQDKWQDIKTKAGIDVQEFVPLKTYDDAITYKLVGAASDVLQLSPEAVLQAFGKYWILFTAKEGYGELMNLFGSNFLDCLQNLNQMHGRMGAMMPELKPPRFSVYQKETQPNAWLVEYHSTRPGLAPMVLGLLEGLAEKHKTNASIHQFPRTSSGGPDIFEIHIQKA